MKQKNRNINDFIKDLASAQPTPGGGGAAGVSGAMAAALIGMVANLTIGKKKYRDVEELMMDIRDEAEQIHVWFLQAVDDDMEAFEQLMQVYKLPQQEPDEQHQRMMAMEEGLKNAAAVPLECMKRSTEILDLATTVGEKGNFNVLSDVECAVYMAAATFYSSKTNVLVNLTSVRDELYSRSTLKELANLELQFREAFREALETVFTRKEEVGL